MERLRTRITQLYKEKDEYILPTMVKRMFRQDVKTVKQGSDTSIDVWITTVEEMFLVLKKRPKNTFTEWLNMKQTYRES